MEFLTVLKSMERTETQHKHPILETTTPMAMHSMMVMRMRTETDFSTLVKQTQHAEKTQVMKTMMVSRIGKKISPVPNGTLQIPILAVLTTEMSEMLAMEPTLVIRWSISPPRLFPLVQQTNFSLLMQVGSIQAVVLVITTIQEVIPPLAIFQHPLPAMPCSG